MIYYESELYHHGVKGMKWGHRKQRLSDTANTYGINVKKYNSSGHSEKGLLRHPDGTQVTGNNTSRRVRKDLDTIYKQKRKETKKAAKEERKEAANTPEAKAARNAKIKKAAVAGAAVAGTALAVYGGYKFNKWVNNQNVNLASHAGMEFANRFSEQIRPKTMMGGLNGMSMHRYSNGQSFANRAGGELSKMVSDKVSSTKGVERVKNAFEARNITRGKKTVYDVLNYDKTVNEILKETDALNKGQSTFAKLVRDTIGMGGSIPRELLK